MMMMATFIQPSLYIYTTAAFYIIINCLLSSSSPPPPSSYVSWTPYTYYKILYTITKFPKNWPCVCFCVDKKHLENQVRTPSLSLSLSLFVSHEIIHMSSLISQMYRIMISLSNVHAYCSRFVRFQKRKNVAAYKFSSLQVNQTENEQN